MRSYAPRAEQITPHVHPAKPLPVGALSPSQN
jgi:hypothetical protein